MNGGAYGQGTVFRVNTNDYTETVLHSFTGGASDGNYPYGGLLLANDGKLYGTTESGGSAGGGAIFRLDTDGGNYTVLHNFTGVDGLAPYATLIQGCDGGLYGTTYQGGTGGLGTAFRMNTDGTGYEVLHNFAGTDGQYPYGSLMIGEDGAIYGTASAGGANGLGTIFKLTWPGGWNFDAPTINDACTNYTLTMVSTVLTGDCPQYSTRTWLLTDTCGNSNTCSQTVTLNSTPPVFTCVSNKTVGSSFYCVGTGQPSNSVLYGFLTTGSGGAGPSGELIQGSDGSLYGAASGDGTAGAGTIFMMSTDGSSYSVVHSFCFGKRRTGSEGWSAAR